MEYLIVKIKGKEDEVLPVLIDGEENGFTCDKMQLDEGFVEISVNVDGAETKEIELVNTTDEFPMEVLIDVT